MANTSKPKLREAGEKDAKARDQALQAAVTQIEKEFGQGSVMRLGADSIVQVEAISTGALSLDLALGVGGVPRGRIVEIFGPESSGKTTLVYHIIAEAQARGGVCAFIDAEHALDPAYAKRIGVDIDELLVSQPDYGEQALEIVDVLTRSGAVDVVAIDSVAALTPRVELEGQMGEQQMGLQARLMSQALRKLAGNLNRAQTICIFTNQIREKIGVMFGCLSASTRIRLADGSSERIAKIVNERLPVKVMSMDPKTGEISPKRIIEYYDNGETEEWLRFEVAGGPGRCGFTCTPNHLIFTPRGERPAEEIEEGDDVLVAVKHYALSDDQLKLIIGSALGDGSLRHTSEHNVKFRVGHGHQQREYCEWKYEMLAPFAHTISPTGNGIGFDTIPMGQLAWLHEAMYAPMGGRTVGDELIAELDERAVAAWYCDDGNFSGSYQRWGHGKAVIYNSTLTRDDKHRLAVRLEELGMGQPTVGDSRLTFSGDRTRQFQEKIAPYVHPSLDYKLHPDLRGRFEWHPDTSDAHLNGTRLTSRTSLKSAPMKVRRKYPVLPAPHIRRRYDLQIEDNHSYLAGGVVVHNSPETQPGGRALKFYSSQRLDIRRIETLKEGTEAVGNRVRVKVVKNKVASPFRQAEFDIEYGVGISREGCILDLALEHDLVQKSGSFFSYGETRLGQGRNNTKERLRQEPELTAELERQIHERLDTDADAEAESESPVKAVEPEGSDATPQAEGPDTVPEAKGSDAAPQAEASSTPSKGVEAGSGSAEPPAPPEAAVEDAADEAQPAKTPKRQAARKPQRKAA
jgi:recombination protein RecA